MVSIANGVREQINYCASLDLGDFERKILERIEYLISLKGDDRVVLDVDEVDIRDELLEGVNARAYIYHDKGTMREGIIPISEYSSLKKEGTLDYSGLKVGKYEILTLDEIRILFDDSSHCFELSALVDYLTTSLSMGLKVPRKLGGI